MKKYSYVLYHYSDSSMGWRERLSKFAYPPNCLSQFQAGDRLLFWPIICNPDRPGPGELLVNNNKQIKDLGIGYIRVMIEKFKGYEGVTHTGWTVTGKR